MRLRKKHFAIPEMQENKYVIFSAYDMRGKWKEEFKNDNKIFLELGAGKGQFIQELAKREPNCNFIIFDRESNAFIYATRKVRENELENVRCVPGDIMHLKEIVAPCEAHGIYINFCNPWPKKKHKKRRLTHPNFLKIYKTILKDGGFIKFKTDDRNLFEESLEYFDEEGFECIKRDFDMKLELYPDNIVTEYENKFRSLGQPIYYAEFKKID
ncbi:tRNA (guanosine(46)-N7)-methyltransferase TrmB [Peptoniphilus sp. GNH]|nr:tRNA (guanine-N(7)-)-methyltransferase [Clostridiales bacterium KA00134]UHR02301.1 tRNA (guanosine(46)-N7)-methyltransferase TrmB [Peptoniphilus sp. GNH]